MPEKAPIVTCARHRLHTDGEGVTTLVCFYGCPLRCKWCINPFTFAENTEYIVMTTEELYDKVRVDALYFEATGGGITFGGGEPLLYPDFIKEFCEINKEWKYYVETSLSVDWENVEKVIPYIDWYLIDCKDVSPEIYKNYTGKDNTLMLSNLSRLIERVGAEKIRCRLPLIPEYNSEEDRKKSEKILKEIGIRDIDFFTYRTEQ